MKKFIVLGTDGSFVIILHACPNTSGNFQWYVTDSEESNEKFALSGQKFESICISSDQMGNALYKDQWIYCECEVDGKSFSTEKIYLDEDFITIVSQNQFSDISFFNESGNIRDDIKYHAPQML